MPSAASQKRASESETLEYVSALLTGLIPLIENARMPFLSYLIQMASIEASDIRMGARSPDGDDLTAESLVRWKALRE